jgi:hypothetical protein
MSEQKVIVGDIVHVRDVAGQCRAAIVTDVTEYPKGSDKFKVCLFVCHVVQGPELRLGQDAGDWHWPELEPKTVQVKPKTAQGQESHADSWFLPACKECGQGHRPGEPHGPVVDGYPLERMTDKQIDYCRRIGRDTEANTTTIGLPEIDALCAEAILRGNERDAAQRSLNNLLARIFRDGGQRAYELGPAALEVADKTLAEVYGELDELRARK